MFWHLVHNSSLSLKTRSNHFDNFIFAPRLVFVFNWKSLVNQIFQSTRVAAPPPIEKDEPVNPCIVSPCGRYSTCKNVNNSPSCACLPGYEGIPPYCRPQCETNSDCPNDLACINEKCTSPCINACGQNAKCSVSLHSANCYCVDGLVGDPFVSCHVPVLYAESKSEIEEVYIEK